MNPEIPADCFPAELVRSAGFLLARLGMSLKMRTMDEFERAGFSGYQYAILALLDEAPRTTQAAIAHALQYDPSQLVSLLDGLEERGLIERRRDPNDRRRHVVSLTPDGRRQLAGFRTIIRTVEDEFLAPLDEEKRAALQELLLCLAENTDSRFVLDAADVA
jgi:DNA-binding MarR family transcriptional regulator